MTPREALAALYWEKAAAIGADEERLWNEETDFLRYRDKAAYWLGIGNEAEAKPQTTPETPIF